jgi:diacylglycerol kinase (ATP)
LSEASAAARRGPIAVLASPRARSFRAEARRLGALEAATRRIGGLFAAVDDAAGTEAALSAARDAGARLLAVAGGDGTLGHVLAAAVKVWGTDDAVPPLGLLRGGTMNTVANGLGIPRGDAVARLTHLADLLSRGAALPTRARPSLKVADRLGFLFGTGVFERFLAAYYAKGDGAPTVATAVATIGHLAGSTLIRGPYAQALTRRTPLTLEVDGDLWPERSFLAVAAGTVPEVGLGFRPFHHADPFAHAFHLLGVTAPATSVVFDLPRIWLGRDLRPTSGRGVLAHVATLHPPRGTPLAWMVDGDLFSAEGPLTVSVGPSARFVLA